MASPALAPPSGIRVAGAGPGEAICEWAPPAEHLVLRGDWKPTETYRFGDIVEVPRIVPRSSRWRRLWCWLTRRPEPDWGHVGTDLFVAEGSWRPPDVRC